MKWLDRLNVGDHFPFVYLFSVFILSFPDRIGHRAVTRMSNHPPQSIVSLNLSVCLCIYAPLDLSFPLQSFSRLTFSFSFLLPSSLPLSFLLSLLSTLYSSFLRVNAELLASCVLSASAVNFHLSKIRRFLQNSMNFTNSVREIQLWSCPKPSPSLRLGSCVVSWAQSISPLSSSLSFDLSIFHRFPPRFHSLHFARPSSPAPHVVVFVLVLRSPFDISGPLLSCFSIFLRFSVLSLLSTSIFLWISLYRVVIRKRAVFRPRCRVRTRPTLWWVGWRTRRLSRLRTSPRTASTSRSQLCPPFTIRTAPPSLHIRVSIFVTVTVYCDSRYFIMFSSSSNR